MDVETAVKLRKELEADILQSIQFFEAESGLCVDSIQSTTLFNLGAEPVGTVHVKVMVTI